MDAFADLRQVKRRSSLSFEEEQIKSLQGWLLKCGIRKVWYRELARFNTHKEKIQHLKNMLAGIGMVGRYSLDKAKRIKEDRELQADVEAVQEYGSQWGKASDKAAKTRSRNAPPGNTEGEKVCPCCRLAMMRLSKHSLFVVWMTLHSLVINRAMILIDLQIFMFAVYTRLWAITALVIAR